MKKTFGMAVFLGIALICALLYLYKPGAGGGSAEKTLVNAFSSTNARLVSAEIYFSGKIGQIPKNVEAQKQFVEQLASEMGVLRNDSFSSRDIRNDTIKKIEVSGVTNKDRSVDINLELSQHPEEKENIMTVSMSDYSQSVGLEEMKADVLHVLKKYHMNPKINSCITGSIGGKLDSEKQNALCNQMLKMAGAKKINAIQDGNLVSVSAYAHDMGDSVSFQGKRMNLNLALRYNAVEDRTYVWIATPVITIEY